MFAGAEPLRGMGSVLFEEGGLGSSEVWVSVLLPRGPQRSAPWFWEQCWALWEGGE